MADRAKLSEAIKDAMESVGYRPNSLDIQAIVEHVEKELANDASAVADPVTEAPAPAQPTAAQPTAKIAVPPAPPQVSKQPQSAADFAAEVAKVAK